MLDAREIGKHFLFAVCIGIVGGFASVLLCICIDFCYSIFKQATWLVWLLPVLGLLQLALYRYWKLRLDMTTHRVIESMRAGEPISPFLAPGVLLGTCLSILGGGSVGKEAGALQMGASLGTLISRPFKIKSIYRKNANENMDGYVAAAGMAATFSALFFAPLGSAMFVLELTHFRKTINKHVVSIVFACFIAFLISSSIGIGDIIDGVNVPSVSWPLVGQCIVVGVAAAVVGTLFDSALHWIHDLTWRISKNYFIWVIVGGLLFATLVTFFQWDAFTGSGGNMLGDALHGQFEPADFAIKALLTLVCLGFWFKGGEIMPSFCIGGLLGGACTFMTGGDPAFGAAVGLISFFAAFSRCPLAAFLMGCEIFGWTMAPFFVIGVVVAYMFGSPVGMYGDGVDRLLRTRINKAAFKTLRERYDNQVADRPDNVVEPGVIDAVEDAVRAFDKAIASGDNEIPPEGTPPSVDSAKKG